MVNSSVLIKKSSYFEKLLKNIPEKGILFEDDPTGTLDLIIKYLQTEKLIKVAPVAEEIEKYLLGVEYYGVPEIITVLVDEIEPGFVKECGKLSNTKTCQEFCLKFLEKNFESATKIEYFMTLKPDFLGRLLSSSGLVLSSEAVAGNALLSYIKHNREKISNSNLTYLLTCIRYFYLPIPTMVQFTEYISYLPPEWETFMLMKLANIENISIPQPIINSVQSSLYMVKRQNCKENLTFKPFHGSLSVKYDDQNRAVVSKTG